jgi:tRNA threonylcarbamoyladenosine biosynthesis protein TsaE
MNEVLVIPTEAALERAVEALLHFAEGRKKIAMVGDLGAGKTAFVKTFCQLLMVEDAVSSPTYSIVNEYVYATENGQEAKLYHLDLYRLRSLEEAQDIGLEEYLYSANYCFVEWPEIAADLLPDDMVFVSIEAQADGSRRFVFSNTKPY